jgi:hypothetical protein
LSLQGKIKQAPDSFITESVHVTLTGFKSHDLVNGIELEKMKKLLTEKFENSLIITQAGYKDFTSFELSPGDFDTFDLQSKFLQQSGVDKHGFPVMQPISLKRLVLHFFNVDIQSGEHSASIDARYTMKLFHVYQKLAKGNGMKNRSDTFDISQFENIPKLK